MCSPHLPFVFVVETNMTSCNVKHQSRVPSNVEMFDHGCVLAGTDVAGAMGLLKFLQMMLLLLWHLRHSCGCRMCGHGFAYHFGCVVYVSLCGHWVP